MSDSGKMNAYLQRADVWSDIRTNFEYFFRLYPEQAGYRHNYAWFAERAGDSAEFLRQVKMFPSTNFAYFGGVDRFNKMLEHAKENAGEKKEGAPASAKGK